MFLHVKWFKSRPKVMLYYIIIIVCCVSTIAESKSELNYPESLYSPSPYNLEDYCDNGKEEFKFVINSWKGAIFQVGYSSKRRKIHKCKINIETHPNFSLVAAIEYMKIQGKRDKNNKWECSDYVQFYSERSTVGDILSTLHDFKFLYKRKSEELCGEKRLDGYHLEGIFDLSTDANSFSTTSNKMSFLFHQSHDWFNNSFVIVVTTFRRPTEQVFAVECEGKQKCYGNEGYCIDKAFVCDSHVNCAFPGAGTDEKLCRVNDWQRKFTMRTMLTIAGPMFLVFVMCLLSAFAFRLRTSRGTGASLSGFPRAPFHGGSGENDAALPPGYEMVILSSSSPPRDDKSDAAHLEMPPDYESLFPPQQQEQEQEEEDRPPPFDEDRDEDRRGPT